MEIVAATAPAVAGNIETIVGDFYPRMFRNTPAVCPMFNEESQRNKVQHRALAQSALAYVGHLANDDNIEPMLARIAERHCAVGVQAEQYSVVHDNFLAATAHVLGDAVTPPVAAAWSAVLMHFAGALIEREKALYEATAWKGCRAFRITEVTEHGGVAKSLALAPVDGDAASVTWTPGQYVTMVSAHNAPRHYTISSHNQFRITPKIHRALGDARPAGRMTSALDAKKVGDVVMLHAPYGTFTLADARGVTADTPLAFVAGGIGITPVVAMAAEARRLNATRPIAFFHCASTTVRPLVEEVPATFTVLGSRGMIGNIVPMLTAHSEFDQQLAGVHFFLCAPHGMLKAAIEHLTANGVALERIHYEAFESHTS
jgi:nitric oxide dioxygenase